jgi:hypothetical protein
MSTTVVGPNSYSLTFNVFSSLDIKNLVVGPVDELILIVLEELEPSRVGAPDLHVIGFSRILDVE